MGKTGTSDDVQQVARTIWRIVEVCLEEATYLSLAGCCANFWRELEEGERAFRDRRMLFSRVDGPVTISVARTRTGPSFGGSNRASCKAWIACTAGCRLPHRVSIHEQ